MKSSLIPVPFSETTICVVDIEGELFDLGKRSDGRIIAKLEKPSGIEVEIAGITEDEMIALAGHMFKPIRIYFTVSR